MDIAKGRDVARRRNRAAGNGSGRVDVAIGNGRNAIGQSTAFNGSGAGIDVAAVGAEFPALGVDVAAAGLDYTAAGLDGPAVGGNIAIGTYREFTIGPLDAAVRVEGGLGCRRRIAAGIEPVRILYGAVQAYFNPVFAEGDLVFLVFVQHQLGRRFLGGNNGPVRIHAGGDLLQDIIAIQAQAAVHRICQCGIRCHTGRRFFFIRRLTGIGFFLDFQLQGIIRLVQGRIRCFAVSCFLVDAGLQIRIRLVQGRESIDHSRVQAGKVAAHCTQSRIGLDKFRIQVADVAGVSVDLRGIGCNVCGIGCNVCGIGRNVCRIGCNVCRVGCNVCGIGCNVGRIGSDVEGIGRNSAGIGLNLRQRVVQIAGSGPLRQYDDIIRGVDLYGIDFRRCRQRGRHPRTHDNSGGQCGHGGFCIPFACVLRDDDIRMPDFTPNDTVRFVHNALLS